MEYGVQLVADADLPSDREWILIYEDDRMLLVVAVSAFCARVVAEGMAAMGNLLMKRQPVAA